MPPPLPPQNPRQRPQIPPGRALRQRRRPLHTPIRTRHTLRIPKCIPRIIHPLHLYQPLHIPTPIRRQIIAQSIIYIPRIRTLIGARHKLLDEGVEAVEEGVGGLRDGGEEVEDVGLEEVEGVAVPVGCGGLGRGGDGAAVEVPDDEVG